MNKIVKRILILIILRNLRPAIVRQNLLFSILPKYRGMGIGTKLMTEMLLQLSKKGYEQASLAVQKENYATEMYKKVGFEIIGENEEEYFRFAKDLQTENSKKQGDGVE